MENVIETFELSTEHNNYPNFTVYDRYFDGEPSGWRVITNEGYVFYDTTENNIMFDPETEQEIPVTYYYTEMLLTRYFNWDNWSLVAVPRDSVNENFIFGGANNDHETM